MFYYWREAIGISWTREKINQEVSLIFKVRKPPLTSADQLLVHQLYPPFPSELTFVPLLLKDPQYSKIARFNNFICFTFIPSLTLKLSSSLQNVFQYSVMDMSCLSREVTHGTSTDTGDICATDKHKRSLAHL